MRHITIAILSCIIVLTGCSSKSTPYICTCGIGTGNEESHRLDANFNPDERQAACEMFQTVDTNDVVLRACEIVE